MSRKAAVAAAMILIPLLVVGHLIALRWANDHLALPTAALVGVVVAIALRHVGLFGRVAALFQRRGGRRS
jgi:hypothetical protein